MSISRKIILTVTENKVITNFVTKYGMSLGAKRFVASENLLGAARKVESLNKQGLDVTLDHLGESVSNRLDAKKATEDSISILKTIEKLGLDSNVSLKLTQLGLDIDSEFCKENIERIVAEAKKNNNFIRIDMEDSSKTDITLQIASTLANKYGQEHIGIVLQSYLYRTKNDLLAQAPNSNIRFVKGAYKEPSSVAFPNKKDVDQNYIDLVSEHLQRGGYAAIATHDTNIINILKEIIRLNNIPRNKFEFQMLYGIRSSLQQDLAKQGYKVRVYTPYGQDWYPYFTRRIAERPANAFFILKNIFKK